MKLNKMIDHTKLGANVTKEQIDQLVEEAIAYDFKSVCVNPIWVKYVVHKLRHSNVLTCTVIGFPHGTHQPNVKVFEAEQAILDGAEELDMVINVHALKSKDYHTIKEEIKSIVDIAEERYVKVILETCYLTDEEIVKACEIAVKAGANFVKTSTGFGSAGATVEHVKLMKQTVGDHAEVKASGGVRTYADAVKMVNAGATRIGTSNGVQIVTGGDTNDSDSSY